MRSRMQKAHFCKRKKSDRHTDYCNSLTSSLRMELLQRFTGVPKGEKFQLHMQ